MHQHGPRFPIPVLSKQGLLLQCSFTTASLSFSNMVLYNFSYHEEAKKKGCIFGCGMAQKHRLNLGSGRRLMPLEPVCTFASSAQPLIASATAGESGTEQNISLPRGARRSFLHLPPPPSAFGRVRAVLLPTGSTTWLPILTGPRTRDSLPKRKQRKIIPIALRTATLLPTRSKSRIRKRSIRGEQKLSLLLVMGKEHKSDSLVIIFLSPTTKTKTRRSLQSLWERFKNNQIPR